MYFYIPVDLQMWQTIKKNHLLAAFCYNNNCYINLDLEHSYWFETPTLVQIGHTLISKSIKLFFMELPITNQ